MATRRSKRSHTVAEEESIYTSSSLTHDTHHPVKPNTNGANGMKVGSRRPLNDLTNGNEQQLVGGKANKHTHQLVEEVEEEHIKTRAQSRSTRVQQPSAKRSKLSASSTASTSHSSTYHAPRQTRHGQNLAAPIQLDAEDEDEEREEDEYEPEDEDIEETEDQDADGDAHMKDVSPSAHIQEVDEDAELLSAKSSAAVAPSATSLNAAASSLALSSASGSAAASAAAAVSTLPLEEQPTWQQCLDDPCQEYADSIYQHLRTTELLLHPDPIYMDKIQGDLTHAMRSILVDWLVEVAQEYTLKTQTLFLAVSYIDRFLSHVQIDRQRLQLVGVTCMLLAAKYWEIWPPSIDEFVFISDKTYAKEEVIAMENSILTVLKFKLTSPTSWEFSRRFCRSANTDKRTEHLVDYLLELILQEAASLTFRPSILAASALFLALYTLHLIPWSERLEINTGIRVEELQTCVRTLHQIHIKTCHGSNTLKSVKTKYSDELMMQVALIKPRNL